jgi:hypothetical protein
MVYEYIPSHAQIVAALFKKWAASSGDLMDIWQLIWADEEWKAQPEDLRSEVDFMFTYDLSETFNSAGEVRLVEAGLTSTSTRSMSDTPPSAWTLWTEVGKILSVPMLRAHIGDVLLNARIQTSQDHVSEVISLYLKAAVSSTTSVLHAALSLARANALARSRGMADELAVRVAMHKLSESLGASPDTCGPALTLLSALSVPPRRGLFEEGEREVVRNRLFALGDSSFTLLDEIARTLARLAENSAGLEEARRWHVGQYLGFASAEENGMRRMHFAQTAADLASGYGLTDLRDAAVLVMQSIDHASMGWKSTGINVPISKNVLRAHLRKYRRVRSWKYALVVFLDSESPSGSHVSNIKAAERTASGSIRALVSRTVYGSHGLPERTNSDFMEEEVARAEVMRLQMSAIFLALELENLRDRYAPPAAEQIADWISLYFAADRATSGYFAESLSMHWAGRFSDSARLSIPLIENAARGLLLALGEPMYRIQRGESPGRFPAMDFYLDALENRNLDLDWIRALRISLLSQGMNLRNLSAHGFKMTFTENESALLVRLAGLLCSMPLTVDRSNLERSPKSTRGRARKRLRLVWC